MSATAVAVRESGGRRLEESSFREFQRLTLEITGIALSADKRPMILTRFSRRLQVLGLDSFEDYLELVRDTRHPERAEFVDTVTTNLTYFFREPHHFDYLRDVVLPERSARAGARGPIRIWSAGCSAGQEPYSIAISVHEAGVGMPVRILATDIDRGTLRHAAAGRYAEGELRGLSDGRRERWLERDGEGAWNVRDSLRKSLIWKHLNLFDPWPIREGVDAIMCRNVLIYFDTEHQERLIRGFARIQRPGDHLFIGHSETLCDPGGSYERVGNTIFRRR